MPKTLDEGLPLFPTDKQTAWALFGSDKDEHAKSFLSKIPHLEHDGCPTKSLKDQAAPGDDIGPPYHEGPRAQ